MILSSVGRLLQIKGYKIVLGCWVGLVTEILIYSLVAEVFRLSSGVIFGAEEKVENFSCQL